MVKITDIVKPAQNIEKVPNGDVLCNSLILIDPIFLNFGGFLLVNSIGTKAIEKRREIKIKGSYLIGLLKFKSILPIDKPMNVINM
tara:strand:- start:47 stop:304 length:258 start_codon:yes stop_codon:yes gene_type:complete